MKKKYIIHIDKKEISSFTILNFDVNYCQTSEELLNSDLFRKVVHYYISYLFNTGNDLITLFNTLDDYEKIIIELYKLLLVIDIDKIKDYNPAFTKILNEYKRLNYFTEGLYNYWRHLSRFAILTKINSQNIIDIANRFNDLVISTYRIIVEKLMKDHFNVYRQLPAGINVCIETYTSDFHQMGINKDIDIIKTVFIRPPYLVNTKASKRTGTFPIFDKDLRTELKLKKEEWMLLPLFVGEHLAYYYFHINYLNHAIGLCNLYKVASPKECINNPPRLICFMGVDESITNQAGFYLSSDNKQVIGFIPQSNNYDYFGYSKKMLLTLHNSLVIKEGKLPIHGAMIRITFKNKMIKNIILVGDSGVGKSELVEAIRNEKQNEISHIRIVYDDMGLIGIDNHQIDNYQLYTSGTEIGAFVRLDDLDQGYAYEEIDRSIFMNPSQTNARVIIPVTSYEEVIRKYTIDLILYANNYLDNENNLIIFNDLEQAKQVFIEGKRQAKSTTEESGLTKSFFANPFGPVQYEEETLKLINKYFDIFKSQHITVGEIFTRLAIPHQEKEGPKKASICLIDYLLQENKK